MISIRSAVLTVSDTSFVDSSKDKAGPIAKQLLLEQGYTCKVTSIVPDEENQIRATVLKWIYELSIDVIIVTGGTGFGVRDRTPEAIEPLIERKASGIVHLLLSSSLKHTPFAALSRPIAGTIQNTLVVTFPGSVKAVKENMEALTNEGILNHAIELMQGGSGKQVHEAFSEKGHYHDHHGDHKPSQPRSILSRDPNGPVAARLRISPYPMVSFEEAQLMIRSNIQPSLPIMLPVSSNLRGYVLAEDVYSPEDVPLTSTTSVDGYALRSTDPPGIFHVLTTKTWSPFSKESLPSGFIYRINTGGVLPKGTDTVIMVEDTEVATTTNDGEEEKVRTLAQVSKGENVRLPGSDVQHGELVLEKGTVINWWGGGGEIGALGSIGRKEIKVYKKPTVALLSTGNELIDLKASTPHSKEEGGIWDTNRPSLQATLEGLGYKVIDLGIIEDTVAAHKIAISAGLEKADILLTTGGTSMGPSDLLKPVLEKEFSGTTHFGRVSMKPGKPTTFTSISIPGNGKETRQPVFALPGNPASALVTFYIFVLPALRIMGGYPPSKVNLPQTKAQLTTSAKLDVQRTEFHRVLVSLPSNGTLLEAKSVEGSQRSSRVGSLCGANGFVVLPPKGEGNKSQIEEGEIVDVILIGELIMSHSL